MSHPTHTSFDVAVVGGGVCGLVVAWRARARGLSRRRARPRRARRAGPRASRPGCSRRSRRPTPASATLLTLGLAERAALAVVRGRARGRDRDRRRATARPGRSSSRATATRPRRWSASWRCASGSACGPSASLPRRRARSSRRLHPRCAPRSRCPAITASTRARCSTRWSRRPSAPASCCAPARRSRGVLVDGGRVAGVELAAARPSPPTRRRRGGRLERSGARPAAGRPRARAPGQGPDPARCATARAPGC